jgi:hypothetical protein
MSTDVRDFEQRIGRLERENRKLKRWAAAACGGFALLGLLGMAAPAICDVVSGERFVLRDASGRQRVLVDAYQTDSPTLTLQSSAGKTLAKLGLDERGEGYLNLYDEKGASKAVFSTARTARTGDGATSTPADEPQQEQQKEAATVVSGR